MNKIGFIGNESMSSMLIDRFLVSGKVKSSEIVVSSKAKSNSESAVASRNQINVTNDNSGVIKNAKYVFLCADPSDTEKVLKEIKDCVSDDTNIISTSFPASINCMESVVSCKVTKLAPTMIMDNGKHVSVICHNNKVKESEAEYIESLLREACSIKVYKAKRF